ncbi:MAG: hypothetical protein FJ145_21470 [Deltaproteobacteria bacterium]|nr:hypothetical protein [Deltaproteobacteria bacterium]
MLPQQLRRFSFETWFGLSYLQNNLRLQLLNAQLERLSSIEAAGTVCLDQVIANLQQQLSVGQLVGHRRFEFQPQL